LAPLTRGDRPGKCALPGAIGNGCGTTEADVVFAASQGIAPTVDQPSASDVQLRLVRGSQVVMRGYCDGAARDDATNLPNDGKAMTPDGTTAGDVFRRPEQLLLRRPRRQRVCGGEYLSARSKMLGAIPIHQAAVCRCPTAEGPAAVAFVVRTSGALDEQRSSLRIATRLPASTAVFFVERCRSRHQQIASALGRDSNGRNRMDSRRSRAWPRRLALRRTSRSQPGGGDVIVAVRHRR
jgi:hypothetical protein